MVNVATHSLHCDTTMAKLRVTDETELIKFPIGTGPDDKATFTRIVGKQGDEIVWERHLCNSQQCVQAAITKLEGLLGPLEETGSLPRTYNREDRRPIQETAHSKNFPFFVQSGGTGGRRAGEDHVSWHLDPEKGGKLRQLVSLQRPTGGSSS